MVSMPRSGCNAETRGGSSLQPNNPENPISNAPKCPRQCSAAGLPILDSLYGVA